MRRAAAAAAESGTLTGARAGVARPRADSVGRGSLRANSVPRRPDRAAGIGISKPAESPRGSLGRSLNPTRSAASSKPAPRSPPAITPRDVVQAARPAAVVPKDVVPAVRPESRSPREGNTLSDNSALEAPPDEDAEVLSREPEPYREPPLKDRYADLQGRHKALADEHGALEAEVERLTQDVLLLRAKKQASKTVAFNHLTGLAGEMQELCEKVRAAQQSAGTGEVRSPPQDAAGYTGECPYAPSPPAPGDGQDAVFARLQERAMHTIAGAEAARQEGVTAELQGRVEAMETLLQEKSRLLEVILGQVHASQLSQQQVARVLQQNNDCMGEVQKMMQSSIVQKSPARVHPPSGTLTGSTQNVVGACESVHHTYVEPACVLWPANGAGPPMPPPPASPRSTASSREVVYYPGWPPQYMPVQTVAGPACLTSALGTNISHVSPRGVPGAVVTSSSQQLATPGHMTWVARSSTPITPRIR